MACTEYKSHRAPGPQNGASYSMRGVPRAHRTHVARISVPLSTLSQTCACPPGGSAATTFRLLLDCEPVAAQDASGQRAIAVPTLAIAPVNWVVPAPGWRIACEPHSALQGRTAKEPTERRCSVLGSLVAVQRPQGRGAADGERFESSG
jgi:hypothetical protein